MKVFVVLVLGIALAGCSAMPWGKPKETGFLTKHVSASIPVTDAYANLRQGFRYCSEKYGVPECKAPEKDGSVLCDIYPGNSASRKADQVLGRIQLSPVPTGTKAMLRVRSNISGNEDILTAWEIFMSGRVREACP